MGCDLKQDDVLRKFALWHFYSPDVHIEGSFWEANWLNGDTSLDRFFSRLTDRLESAQDPDTVVGTAGAMLHYVQDVAVPAHVVPIFHPIFGVPRVIYGDKVDGAAFTPATPGEDEATCARLLDGEGGAPSPFPTILNQTAAATLAAVKQAIPPAMITMEGDPQLLPRVERSWALFWDLRRHEDGFADYGCGGNVFGEETFKCRFSLFKSVKIEVRPEAYRAFVEARHLAAVEASVRVIAAAAARPALAGAGQRTSPGIVCPVAVSRRGGGVALCEEPAAGAGERVCPPDDRQASNRSP